MLLEIDHHSGVPIYQQVVRQIRQQIMTGDLKEGDQLETVRELATRLKVNPMTISKAYSLLETQGLVERRRGIGLFAAKIKDENREQIKDQMLESIMNKAAVTAIQLGLSEEQAAEYFKKQFRQFNSANEGDKNE
ncbi:MAG: GntR family transcriptional regulator [Planctomycetaceae bacterium]|nr:GntR family transcriptional regulator [Planctomycetaceae bacterium]